MTILAASACGYNSIERTVVRAQSGEDGLLRLSSSNYESMGQSAGWKACSE